MDFAVAVAVHSPTWESEEGVLKKQKLQEITWPGKDKVCLALLCFKINENGDACKTEYNICIFDLLDSVPIGDPSYFPPISPVLNIDCGFDNVHVRNMDTDAFWVFGQKVYMFEGSHNNGRKAIYSFDISAPGQRRIVKSEISGICNMHSPKRHPAVVPISNSKNLLVFPTEFLEDSTSKYIGGFELFDPAKKSLDRLPDTDIKASTYWKLLTYGFIDATRFLIQLTFVSQFVQLLVLDFDKLNKGWVYMGNNYGGQDPIPSWPRSEASSFQLIEDRFCVTTTYGAFDIRVLDNISSVSSNQFKVLDPESAMFEYVPHRELEYRVTVLNHDDVKEECHLCEAYVDRFFDKQYGCRILLDDCRADLRWYKQDYHTLGIYIYKPNYTSCVKSVQFCVDLGGEYHLTTICLM